MEQGQSRGRIGGLRTAISIINNQVIIVSNAQLPTVETKPDDRPSEWIVQEMEAESGREMDYEGTHFYSKVTWQRHRYLEPDLCK